jgi:hypothetical protein
VPRWPPALSEESINAIVAWTSQHGLLGVFHQTTVQIEDPVGESIWTRAFGHWEQSFISPMRRNPQDRTCLATRLIEYTDLERQNARARLLNFLCSDLSGEMPAPDSDEFFLSYSEPLMWEWIEAAHATAEAIFQRDENTLNILAGSAARVRSFEGERVRSEIVFPSLLSAFAEMAFQDFEEGNRLGRCAHCDELFISDRTWTTYCSQRCATKERQRRFLERNPTYYRREKPKTKEVKKP